ncbi:MAG: MATE family efflux transporter [Candidatus Eremiobacteraeota bacterium]|nr:MATE family efflux transporter [Candidatus Eremiobacteraeota bacterium]
MAGPNILDESRPMWRSFVIFLIPLMLSSVLQSAGSTLNSIFVGRLIGVDALGAISAFFPLLFFLISFLVGLSSGASVLIGQAYGAGDQHKMKRVTGTVLLMGLALGVVVAIIGLLFADRVMNALGTPHNIFSDALGYARIVLVFSPILFAYIIYVTALRGTGDSQTPFYFLIISTVVGIVLTPMLIRGWFGLPHLGVFSAAVAFVVSNFVAFASMLIYLRARRHPLALDKEIVSDLRFDPDIARRAIQIGVPTGLQVVMVSLAEIAVLSFVNRFGSHATAAYGAVNQVVSYVQFPAVSMGITASIFGAQCIGARRNDKLASVVHVAVALNYIVGAVLVALCYFFAWNILGWFITDPGTLRLAHTLLFITLWGYLIFGNSAVLSGVMRASGAVLWPTAISIFGIWGVEVPTAYIFMHRIGLDGVWIGYPVAFCVTLMLQSSYYFFVWKKQQHERLI